MTSLSHGAGKRLRIAHLTTVDMSLALLLATELQVDQEAGHEVFGLSAAGPYVERVEALGVRHIPIKALTRRWNLRGDAAAFLELFRTLRRLNLDVLHTHNPKTGVMGRIAGRLAGVPVVVNTCHGLWACAEDPLLKRLFVYGAEALAIRFSDFELFQNSEDAKTLRRFLKPGRWKVVGNGIDLERFQPDPEGRARVRAEWGIRDDQLVVGTIGRRVREKGLAEYAEAAARLVDKAVFVWVGPEDDTDAPVDVPHQEAIRFIGERTDMPAVYSALDVFVLPSYREGFSRASMEAAACGLPVLLSDIRGCREIGTHEQHLLLVPPRDGVGLTGAVERLLADSSLRIQLGVAARERAVATFDQTTVATESLATYQQVAITKHLAARSTPVSASGHERRLILHVLPHNQARGAQTFAGHLRDELIRHPQQQHLLVTLFDESSGAARPDIAFGIPTTTARRVIDLRAVTRLSTLIHDSDAAVVVAHGGEALKYVIPAAGPVPTIYKKTGLSTAEISRPSRVFLYGLLARQANRVVAVSTDLAHQVSDLFSVPADRISLIPNGRDPEVYHPATERPGTPTLLWVGQLEDGKRPQLFLDTVLELRKSGLEFSALMVGDGSLRARLANAAAHLHVDLLGVRSDVPELLRTATVLLMTSDLGTEGMPGVILEAGLSGVPVVSTNAAGVADVIKHGETGFIVSDSAAELAKTTMSLLANRELVERIGRAARQRCLAEFSLSASAQRWQRLVATLI